MIGDSGAVTLTTERHDAAGERTFRAAAAVLFVVTALATVWWCGSMSGGMPMPGGWTMSMAWMRMPGQTWPEAAATFMAMWVLMMVAMMLPSLVPMLSRYRRVVGARDERRLATLTTVVGAGYFFVWTLVGAAAYPLGVALSAAAMQWPPLSRCVPVATGIVLVLAGFVQHTAWKRRALAHCREGGCVRSLRADGRTAWSHGIDLGLHCARCCSGLMVAMLVTDTMDVRTMALIATGVSIERLAPRPELFARTTGVLLVAAGTIAIAQAALG